MSWFKVCAIHDKQSVMDTLLKLQPPVALGPLRICLQVDRANAAALPGAELQPVAAQAAWEPVEPASFWQDGAQVRRVLEAASDEPIRETRHFVDGMHAHFRTEADQVLRRSHEPWESFQTFVVRAAEFVRLHAGLQVLLPESPNSAIELYKFMIPAWCAYALLTRNLGWKHQLIWNYAVAL